MRPPRAVSSCSVSILNGCHNNGVLIKLLFTNSNKDEVDYYRDFLGHTGNGGDDLTLTISLPHDLQGRLGVAAELAELGRHTFKIIIIIQKN